MPSCQKVVRHCVGAVLLSWGLRRLEVAGALRIHRTRRREGACPGLSWQSTPLQGGVSRPGGGFALPGWAGRRLDSHGVDAQAGAEEGAQAGLGAGAGLGQALRLDAAEVQGEGHMHALRQAALDGGGVGGDAEHAGGVRGAEVAGLLVVLLHACRHSAPQRTAHRRDMEQRAVMARLRRHTAHISCPLLR